MGNIYKQLGLKIPGRDNKRVDKIWSQYEKKLMDLRIKKDPDFKKNNYLSPRKLLDRDRKKHKIPNWHQYLKSKINNGNSN